jgi:hypothetical protein
MGGDDTLGREPIHANAHIDVNARDPYLVSRFELVSAQAFAVYRLDPHVVVFCASALGRCFVGLPSQGAGVDLYPRASRIRRVVLDPPGNSNRGVEQVWRLPQQQENAEKPNLRLFAAGFAFSCHQDSRRGGAPWENEATFGPRAMRRARCPDRA